MRWGMLLGLVLSTACAAGLPRCPKKGGPTWRAVESEHFVVYTDESSAAATATVEDLEFVRRAVAEFLLPGWDGPPGRIPVVSLHGGKQASEFFPRDVHGWYSELLLQPFIVLAGSRSFSTSSLVKHEMGHYLVDAFVPTSRLPRWVSEGLASYIESIVVDRPGGRVTFGKTVDDRVLFALARYLPQRIMNEWKVDEMQEGESAFYGQSWLKVHYLINEHGGAFAAFLGELRDGRAEPAAWEAAFPDLPQAQLDARLTQYARAGRYTVMTLRVAPAQTRVVERTVDDADVHAWRALLYGMRHRAKGQAGDGVALARARAEIAEAQREELTNVRALAAELLLGEPPAPSRAEQAAKAHPDDWLAWFVLSAAYEAASQPEKRKTALAEALRLSLANPSIRLRARLLTGAPPSSAR